MKITCVQWMLAVVFSGLTLARNGMAQDLLNRPVSVQLNDKDLRTVLHRLEKIASVKFTYVPQLIAAEHKVSVRATNDRLEDVLNRLLKPLNISYEVSGTYIVLRKESSTLLPDQSAVAVSLPIADLTIMGTVTDEKGDVLPGVSVLLKGTQRGTTTNATGEFKLAVPDNAAVLVFSFVGYQSQEIRVGSQSTLTILLVADEKSLDEIVVVGYGTQKKSDVTGSLVSVSSTDFKNQPVTGVGQALQGRAAGVQVTQSSNAPGGGVSIRIRGGNSIQAGNEPLYVIDGFPVYNSGGTDFNPNDIESIEVLKDASATAIYGSRGANGVVIITTKRGKQGKGQVDFQSYYGPQQVSRTLPLLNGTEYAQFVNEARTNAGQPRLFSDADITKIGAGTDWQKQIYRPAPIQNYQLTFSGGNDKTRYLLSGNVFNQQGVLINSDFKRYSLRLNMNSQLTNWLNVGTAMTVIRSQTNAVPTDGDGSTAGGQSIIYGAFMFSPTQPVTNPDGSYLVDNTVTMLSIGSPVAQAVGTTNNLRSVRIFGNVFADVTLAKDLTFRTSFGTDLTSAQRGIYYAKALTKLGQQTQGQASIGNASGTGWLTENTLTYKKSIAANHNVVFLGGFTSQNQRSEQITTSAIGYATDNLGFNGLATGTTVNRPQNSGSQWQLNSVLARVNYDYKNKYLLTATVRSDGSSRFAAGNKWGTFPSASVAWRISEEGFLSTSKSISDLKVRASYGLTGNTEILPYQAIDVFTQSNYNFNGQFAAGFVPLRVGNRELTWETTYQTDLGVDLGLMNNRISLTADYYLKTTRNLLFNFPLPATSGYNQFLKNVGTVRNSGFELGITSVNTTGAFKWTTNLNLATNHNEVTDLGGSNDVPVGGVVSPAFITSTGILRIGQPVGNFYGYQFGGIFQNQGEIDAAPQQAPAPKPGDRKYLDTDGNRVINPDDRIILGQAQPKLFGGITNNISYKGIDVSLFVQGMSGNSILNTNRFELENLTGVNNQSRDVLNRWTPTNPGTTIPRANATGTVSLLSSRQVEDGSFLRVKSLVIGYTLPSSALKLAHLSTCRVYVSSQNLVTFTRYSGLDPEVSRFGQATLSQGIDYGSYPNNRSYIVGLNVSF